ncbi:hypothetical protein UT300012_21480 [Paraclostridium bifermentans]
MGTERMSLGEQKKSNNKALEELLVRLTEYGSRPHSLINTLVERYPQFIEESTGYHGFVSNYELDEALNSYKGYASFSESLIIASRFAVQYNPDDFKTRAVIRQKGKFFVLHKFIEHVRRQYPDLEFFKEYCSELEMYAVPENYEVVEDGNLEKLTTLVNTKVWYGLSYYLLHKNDMLLDRVGVERELARILEYDTSGIEKPSLSMLALYEVFKRNRTYWGVTTAYHGFNGMMDADYYLDRYEDVVCFSEDLGQALKFANINRYKNDEEFYITNTVLRYTGKVFHFKRLLSDIRKENFSDKLNFLIDRFIREEEVWVYWEDVRNDIDILNWREVESKTNIDIIRNVLINPKQDSVDSTYFEYLIYRWCAREYDYFVRRFIKSLLIVGVAIREDLRYEDKIYSGILLKPPYEKVYQSNEEVASFSSEEEQACKFLDDEVNNSKANKENILGMYLGKVNNPVAFNLSMLMTERTEYSKNYFITDCFDGYSIEEEKIYWKVYDELEDITSYYE